MRQKILGARQSLERLEAFRMQQPWWVPYPLFLSLAERKSEKVLASALRGSNPGMLARMEGMAEGSGLPLRSFCLMNAMEAVIGSVEGRTATPPLGACSALAVRGKRSRAGEPIISRNFDYPPLFLPFFMLRESRPQKGYRSLDFAVAPQPGTIDGVNEKGLADHGPNGVPDGASPCVHTDYFNTTATLHWFPTRRSVRAAYGYACAARFVEIAL